MLVYFPNNGTVMAWAYYIIRFNCNNIINTCVALSYSIPTCSNKVMEVTSMICSSSLKCVLLMTSGNVFEASSFASSLFSPVTYRINQSYTYMEINTEAASPIISILMKLTLNTMFTNFVQISTYCKQTSCYILQTFIVCWKKF